jgi:hypothetical protein
MKISTSNFVPTIKSHNVYPDRDVKKIQAEFSCMGTFNIARLPLRENTELIIIVLLCSIFSSCRVAYPQLIT